jgi:predicted ATP-grasp superfamily ATP-dependent carboligase
MTYGIFLLSGYNQRAVIACCRWAAERGIPVHIAARGPQDPIYLTSHAGAVFVERTSAVLDTGELCNWIRELRSRHGHERVLVAPSTEFFNRFLLADTADVERAGGIVPLPPRAVYETVSDKFAFGKLCAAHGIAVPREFAVAPDTYPFVAKPRTYASITREQLRPHLIHSREQHQAFAQGTHAQEFYYQEFVHGRSVYLLAHIAKSGQAMTFAQENLIQQGGGGSVVLARGHDFHGTPMAEPYLDMLRSIDFHGLVMIEVRVSEATGACVMIEANPRLWGPFQFVVDNGVDLLGALLADHGLGPVPDGARPKAEQPYYFWSGGLSPGDRPFAFHNYSGEAFVDDYQQLARADLFRRADTVRLYEYELSRQ